MEDGVVDGASRDRWGGKGSGGDWVLMPREEG